MPSNPAQTPVKIAPSKWPRGSEWRRWDLHVHTPESRLGNAFSGVNWEDYVASVETLATEAKVSVIGVTDYMTIDGYERLLREKNTAGRLAAVDLLIPNIEFRMMPPTADGKAINLHLLVDPTDNEHVDKIKRALRNLKFPYDGNFYGCCKEELIAFARAQDPGLADDEAAYTFGIQQFKPDRTIIKKWLDNEKWLRSNSLVGIANGKDGISGLPIDGFAAVRDELLKWSHFIFSGNPRDREHYLGLKPGMPKEEVVRQYGSLKPCIHGSDAHEINKLFKPDQNRFCWLKSDPTFNGLRQILWEPGDRVHVGEQPPQPSDHSQQIRRIRLSNDHGWFAEPSIELNSGLVTVIGEKGAGKTAVADLSAFASGYPLDKKSLSSFITKGALHLSGLKVELEWGGGSRTIGHLTGTPFISEVPRVRYLSQDFVEKLCSSDHEGEELQKAIEDVVFAKLDEIQKEGYSSFGELRKAREAASSFQKESLRGEQAALNKEVNRLQEAVDQRGAKLRSKAELEQQVEELKKQLPDATQAVDQDILVKLEAKQATLKSLEEQVSQKIRRRRVIEGAVESIGSVKKGVEQEVGKIRKQLAEIEIPESILENILPIWRPDFDALLLAEIHRLDKEISGLKGGENASEEPASEGQTISSVQGEIEKLKELVSKDEVGRKRLLDLQKQISERTANAERLDKEVRNIDEKVSKTLEEQFAKQVELYLDVFKALAADEEGLKELYSPMQAAIERVGGELQFSVSVGYQVDTRAWLDRSIRFYDGRRGGSEDKRAEIERLVDTKLAPAWKSGDAGRIRSAFEEFLTAIDIRTFPEKFGTSKLSRVELSDWVFSVEHVSLSYKIHYAGTELEFLSPGTRGIALLVLYLLMDEDDTRPLLIDQPEGNLDNSSIYKELVPYIRRAKKRRQIILITHNPNLVVATDAEQVIVATAERSSTQPYPRLKYESGGLEHSHSGNTLGIREAVCLLLEGGEDAFKARENRYSLDQI